MYTISKAPETMTSKERVRRTMNFEKADRIPIDYCANGAVNARLMEGLGVKDPYELLDALGVDFRWVNAPYTGKKLFPDVPGMAVDPVYGYYYKWVVNQFGGYNDFCYFPLKDAEPEKIYAFPTPDPDDFDYQAVVDQARFFKDKALYVGNAGIPDLINSMGRVMGMEDALVNIHIGEEATMDLIDRKISFELKKTERELDILRKNGQEADLLWIGEDLGTQIGPMISMELFRRTFKPIMKQFVDLADSYHIPVMIHSCGSSSWAYEEYIDIGIRAVDTLQPEPTNMSPAYLAEHFGGRLAMHGSISTAMLAVLSPEEMEQVCIDTIKTLMPYNGYMFAPTHAIQDNTPVENLIAMYNAAHTYGRYI